MRWPFHTATEVRTVLDGVDFYVRPGEIFGILGANGAGKTTLLKVLAAILSPDGGWARVNGWDVAKDRLKVLASVTLLKSGGWTGLLYQRSVFDNLRFYGELCGLASPVVEARARNIIDVLGLSDKAHEFPWYLSAGQRQKVALAAVSMLNTPVVLLDEPTTHLDPVASAKVRSFIKNVMNESRRQTIILSTHYLEEAEQLCDRVAIMHNGQVLACDRPERLISAYGTETIQTCIRRLPSEILKTLAQLPGVTTLKVTCQDATTRRYTLRFHMDLPSKKGLPPILSTLKSSGVEIIWVRSCPATLREAYFSLVGRDIA